MSGRVCAHVSGRGCVGVSRGLCMCVGDRFRMCGGGAPHVCKGRGYASVVCLAGLASVSATAVLNVTFTSTLQASPWALPEVT